MYFRTFCNNFSGACEFVFQLWSDWHMVILSPIFLGFCVVFILPVFVLIFLYGTVVFLHVYRHRRRQIYDAYAANFWDAARLAVAAFYDAQATIWNGKGT